MQRNKFNVPPKLWKFLSDHGRRVFNETYKWSHDATLAEKGNAEENLLYFSMPPQEEGFNAAIVAALHADGHTVLGAING